MRRVLPWMGLVLLVVAGCRARNVGPEPGAATSEMAVQEFLNATRSQDLQAMSAVWGNEVGLTRDRVGRQELEQRLLILICHLRHDQASVGAAERGENGRTLHRVAMGQGTKSATVPFLTVRNARSGRWFVEEVDITPVRNFCSRPANTSPRG